MQKNFPPKKLISIGEVAFAEYDEKSILPLAWDVAVYSYSQGSYDGTGILVAKVGDKYFYHELGHCSCNGPMVNIESSANALYTLDEVIEILQKGYDWDPRGKAVVDEIKKHELST